MGLALGRKLGKVLSYRPAQTLGRAQCDRARQRCDSSCPSPAPDPSGAAQRTDGAQVILRTCAGRHACVHFGRSATDGAPPRRRARSTCCAEAAQRAPLSLQRTPARRTQRSGASTQRHASRRASITTARRRLCWPAPATFPLYRRACALEARLDYGQGSAQFASDHTACAEPCSHAACAEASSSAGRLAHGRSFWAIEVQRPLRGNPDAGFHSSKYSCSFRLALFDFPFARAEQLPRFAFLFLKELLTQREAQFIFHNVRKKFISECALSLSPYVCFRLATIPTSRIDRKASQGDGGGIQCAGQRRVTANDERVCPEKHWVLEMAEVPVDCHFGKRHGQQQLAGAFLR
jgi:hypothetical protein